jgi:drug/metabolite transporter (DMT)-like permease
MLAGVGLLSTMDALAKWLVNERLHVMQLLFVRSLLICIGLWIFYSARGQARALAARNKRAQWLRGLLGFLAPFCFFSALVYLPLTDSHVVGYSSIFMITITSALVLKEHIGPHRWTAVVIGYVGVLIAIGPTGGGSLAGYALVLLSSAAYAGLFISGKWLSSTETPASLVFYYNLGVGAVAMLWLPWVWQTPSLSEWAPVVLFALIAVFGQYCMTRAYALAEASLLAPLEYTSLLWVVVFDAVIWQTLPAANTLIGSMVIITSSLYVIHRERRRTT